MTTETTTAAGEDTRPAEDTGDAVKKPSARRFVPLFVLAALGVAYAGYNFYQRTRPYEWSGTVEARTITVGSRTGGRVKEVLVKEGDEVKAGQPLVTLEPGDLDAQRLMAAGALA
ncbi:MAG: biotin/lipoyl-binding protein [Polyangiaceae bacterium]